MRSYLLVSFYLLSATSFWLHCANVCWRGDGAPEHASWSFCISAKWAVHGHLVLSPEIPKKTSVTH